MALSTELKEKLKKYVRGDQLFGPSVAPKNVDPDVAAALFDWSNLAFAELLHGSHVIIGRRGSGKSSLLGTYKSKRFLVDSLTSDAARDFGKRHRLSPKKMKAVPDIIIEVNTPKVVYELEAYCKGLAAIPGVEVLAEIWTNRIWFMIGEEIRKQPQHLVLWQNLPDKIKNYISNRDIFAASPSGGELTPEEFSTTLSDYLLSRDKASVITFDNVEDHKFEDLQNAVLAGLCAATGDIINAPTGPLDVKLCLPAEVFPSLSTVLFRPDKDFHTKQYLHWNAEELMHLAAHRLKTYLEIYHPASVAEFAEADITERSVLKQFWSSFLPSKLTNSVGIDEDPLTYILRHTQMLPRQLLSILNNIAALKLRDGVTEVKFDEADIVAGVMKSEEINKNAVLSMYIRRYPYVRDLCSLVLPRLTPVFSYGSLQSIWQSSAKKQMEEMNCPDFLQFWQLMLSTGALGVVESSSKSDFYVVGRFEYNTEHQLYISDKDNLCVHPMFSRIYNVKRNGFDRVILPRGSDFRVVSH